MISQQQVVINNDRMQNHWLVQFGHTRIPESWHQERNGKFVTKNKSHNEKESVMIGIKQIKLNEEAKNKLINDIHDVIKIGILEPHPIYEILLTDGKLTQSDGRKIPFDSFYRHAATVRKELKIKKKTRTEKIIELFKSGVTDRNELAKQVGCTEDHVSKVLRTNGLKKRIYKTKGEK